MKKFIYSLFAVLTLSCALVSCGDDDSSDAKIGGNPATAAAGTYKGTWTVTLDSVSVTTPGTITVTATDSAYTADFAFAAESFRMLVGTSQQTLSLDVTSVANIAYNGSTTSFDFSNSSTTTAIGQPFAGKIFDGVVTTNFSLEQKAGRKKYTFNYAFVGQKQ